MANLDIAPGFTGVAQVVAGGVGPYSGQFPNSLINPDRNNVSPRVSLAWKPNRSEEHTSELQSLRHLVCRLLLEKKKAQATRTNCGPCVFRRRVQSQPVVVVVVTG